MIAISDLQHKQNRLTEALLSALDVREAARDAGSSLLDYLADLLVTRVREELADVTYTVEEHMRRITPS